MPVYFNCFPVRYCYPSTLLSGFLFASRTSDTFYPLSPFSLCLTQAHSLDAMPYVHFDNVQIPFAAGTFYTEMNAVDSCFPENCLENCKGMTFLNGTLTFPSSVCSVKVC